MFFDEVDKKLIIKVIEYYLSNNPGKSQLEDLERIKKRMQIEIWLESHNNY